MLTTSTRQPVRLFSTTAAAHKTVFYKKVVFYKQISIIPQNLMFSNQNFYNFLTYVLTQPISRRVADDYLRRVYVAANSSLFLHINGKKKYTALSPKLNFLILKKFIQLTKKELLILPCNGFVEFFNLDLLKKNIYFFLPQSIKQQYFLSNTVIKRGAFFWQKLTFNSFQSISQYFFYKFFMPFLSKFQKKINFLQFNIFFQKYIYTYL